MEDRSLAIVGAMIPSVPKTLKWRLLLYSYETFLKGVGMRWSEDGFNHLLHLRLAWVNGSFEALFQVQLQPSPNT